MSDRGFAAQLAEDLGPEDVQVVLRVFEADVVRLSAALAAAADAGAFRRAAHGLAGAAGAVGAAALEAACRAAMAGAEEATLARMQAEIAVAAEGALADLARFRRA